MKCATLLLGAVLLLPSMMAARAADDNDPQIFVCEPNLTVVQVLHGGEMKCSKSSCAAIRAFIANGKQYPRSSQLFRYEPGEQDTLHDRGRRCVGPFAG
jgi:hypothetical protein